MTLEAEKSRTPNQEVTPAPGATPEPKESLWLKVPLGTVGALATVAAALLAGNFLIGNTEKAFIKEKRIVAYGEYVEDLLTLELKYKDSKRVLESADIAASAPKAKVLFDELETALDDVKRSKSVVDVVGSKDVAAAGETAINLYGDLKGEMQDHLLARSEGREVPDSKQTYQESLTQMQKEGREPFSLAARGNLDIPDQ